MENEKTKTKTYGFDCVSKPIPAGTKSHGRLARPGDPEPSAMRMWLLIGAAMLGVLIAGVVIGRMLDTY